MSFYVEKIFIYNNAPFTNIALDFVEHGINVLTGLNGKGKTTIISFIVDAIIEFSKEGFYNEYEAKLNSYYRISSSLFLLDKNEPSIVYIRFKNNDTHIDYLNIRGKLSKEKYEELIPFENHILWENFSTNLNESGNVKTHTDISRSESIKIFNDYVVTYFPSYRYETPGFLNDIYSKKIEFSDKARYSGYLPNPIEVIHSLDDINNWIMDVVLDWMVDQEVQEVKLPTGQVVNIDVTAEKNIWDNLNHIVTEVYREKSKGKLLRFGIGTRNNSGKRLSIVSTDASPITTYSPNLSVISSGESSIIGIFTEILRQADKIHPNIHMGSIEGIVIIDEIDKHLHMKLQKEVLPKLLILFPRIQFILTSHSPFFNMGLADLCKNKSRVFDLDNSGLSCEPEKTVEFENFYSSILQNNDNYHVMYNELKIQTESITKPFIFTEGKTDWKHLKTVLKLLQNNNEFTDIDVNFFEYTFENGDSKLNTYLENICKTPHPNKIIGIFDCDEANGKKYSVLENGIKKFGNNVFSLSIPIPDFRNGMGGISVEFLYSNDDLKQLDSNNRRIYTTDEFNHKPPVKRVVCT